MPNRLSFNLIDLWSSINYLYFFFSHFFSFVSLESSSKRFYCSGRLSFEDEFLCLFFWLFGEYQKANIFFVSLTKYEKAINRQARESLETHLLFWLFCSFFFVRWFCVLCRIWFASLADCLDIHNFAATFRSIQIALPSLVFARSISEKKK